MKKLLLGSLTLLIFSLSIMIFQISCKKDANAGPVGVTQVNKICYFIYDMATAVAQIWTANYDGSSQSPINITLPGNYSFRSENCSLSPDGQKIFFIAFDGGGANHIMSCNIDGTNLTDIVVSSTDMKFGSAN